MSETSPSAEVWSQRVAEWRASGERAEVFSRRGGYAASTLRWWASKLKRDMAAPSETTTKKSEVRLARVVRERSEETQDHAITVILPEVHARVLVGPGADRETLEMVLDLLRQVVPW